MKSPSLDKLQRQQRTALNKLCNSVTSSWSFGKIKSWEDVYSMTGIPSVDIKSGTLTYAELQTYIGRLKSSFEQRAEQASKIESQRGNEVVTVAAETLPVSRSSIQSIPDTTISNPDLPSGGTSSSNSPEEAIVNRKELSVKAQSDTLAFNDKNNYGLPENPNHKAFLFWFQKKAIKEILDGFLGFDVGACADIGALKKMYLANQSRANAKRGMLLLAATGTGKTFMAAAVIRYLYDIGFHDNKTWGHTYYLYVTRATIVEQTKRVFENIFLLSMKMGVEVVNIEQLRSRAGSVWIQDEVMIQAGQEIRTFKWKGPISPCVILWDESQGLKNDGSVQNLIAVAYNELKVNTFQLFISATPFTRVCEAKCFAVSTRKSVSGSFGLETQASITNENWPTYSSSIAHPSAPDEHNEAAVERLVKDLDKYIVRVRGVRPQFDAINKIEMIDFKTTEERDYYAAAWDRYLKEKAKLQAAGMSKGSEVASGNSRFALLVQFLKFRMAAEYCRRHIIAERLYNTVEHDGMAAVAALNFKNTIIAVVKILHEDYGVPRDKISLVWGGGQTDLTKKQKMRAAIKAKAEALEAAGMSADELLRDMALEDVEDRVLEELPEHLRLGDQSKEERQREIDRFQSGRSLYCLYTFRAGGVGLSLHHTDELTKIKARRQKNGYAVVADIPSIPVRPRRNFVAPTYSAIELVQGLGRCPRLTSLSNTEQILLFYRGTIEVDVAAVVSQKLRCLSKVVRQRESWNDMIVGNKKKEDYVTKDIPAEEVGTNYDDLNNNEEGEDE